MKYNYDLTVICPGIRHDNWNTLYDHMKRACKRYSYEMIFSGPNNIPDSLQHDKTIKYIRTFGSPTRAMHFGTLLAEGRLFTWVSDDAWLTEDSIDMAIDLLLANDAEKDIVCMRYVEGPGHSGAESTFGPEYWIAGTHPDLHAPGIDRTWKIPLVPLVSLNYYRELGGLDCLYDHLNLNVLDFGFRAQRNGSKVLMSSKVVQNCDFELNRTTSSHPVIAAFHENDRPRLWSDYAEVGTRPIRIEENWKESEVVWSRRYK